MEHFCYYVTYLYRYQHLAASTIQTTISAIAHFYKMKNLDNPADYYAVKKLIAKYGKTSKPAERLPINRKILTKLLTLTRDRDIDIYYKSAFYTIYFLMYHMAMRISEICNYSGNTHHAIRLEDIKIKRKTGDVQITLYSYKNSTEPITYTIKNNDTFLHYLQTYMRLRGPKTGTLMLHRSGSLISRTFVTTQLKNDLTILRYNADLYNTHSLRIGRASDMAKEGNSDRQIAAIGRWKSNAFLSYIKNDKVTV